MTGTESWVVGQNIAGHQGRCYIVALISNAFLPSSDKKSLLQATVYWGGDWDCSPSLAFLVHKLSSGRIYEDEVWGLCYEFRGEMLGLLLCQGRIWQACQ